jgi:3-hydroxyisobutyrate dehydrogenase-like beta-hydroxyacid dehydrogenase
MKSRVAVLGAGRIGSSLARALVAAGHETHVWNRTPARCEPLLAAGARLAGSVEDAVRAADVTFVAVADAAATHALLAPSGVTPALAGKTLVQLTSGTPDDARELCAWALARGADYLDGAVMVTPDLVGTDACTVLYAGARTTFDRLRPTLLAFGGRALHVGTEVGQAAALDVALITTMWGSLFGVLQAIAVCDAEAIPLAVFEPFLESLAPITKRAVAGVLERAREGTYGATATTRATVNVHHAGVKHLLALCTSRGLRTALPAAFDQLLGVAVAAGHGEDELAVVRTLMRRS